MARDIVTALNHTNEVELSTVGRVSGRKISHPVWFVRHDKTLLLMPVSGATSDWYRNVLRDPHIDIKAGGIALETEGRPITEPEEVRRVVDDFRAKYGVDEVAKYYPKPEVAVQAALA